MKGLIVKDFKLMEGQKNFFLMVIAISVLVAVFNEEPSFITAYLPFIASMFTLSTISYDEFDNGNAFLFSLPVTRKEYIMGKYGFGIASGVVSWLLAILVAVVAGMFKENVIISDTIIAALIILPLIFIPFFVMLPLQLKFGGEKARIVVLLIIIITVVAGAAIGKAAKILNTDWYSVIAAIEDGLQKKRPMGAGCNRIFYCCTGIINFI